MVIFNFKRYVNFRKTCSGLPSSCHHVKLSPRYFGYMRQVVTFLALRRSDLSCTLPTYRQIVTFHVRVKLSSSKHQVDNLTGTLSTGCLLSRPRQDVSPSSWHPIKLSPRQVLTSSNFHLL